MYFLPTILQLVGACTATFVTFTISYASFLTISGRRQYINRDVLASFGLLAPTIWTGMSDMIAIIGTGYELLPNSTTSVYYAGLICLLPASWLTHSVIKNEIHTNSVSPASKTSRKSIPTPKRPPSNPPPPRYW